MKTALLALGAALASAAENICTSNNCKGDVCTFTLEVNPFAGPTGYYTFQECGEMANPVIGLMKGKTYLFDQGITSNWYHPLGFAYEADGAHTGVDELEPTIVPPGSSSDCAASASCQAPLYFKNDEFVGVGNGMEVSAEDFGLDVYEPDFFYPRDQWGENEYKVHLTVTQDTPTDFFYFCHIHAGMSGRVKVLGEDGMPLTDVDEPALPADYYKTPSEYDQGCGTYGLEPYSEDGTCGDTFVCSNAELGTFGDCLRAMDCAMDLNMKTPLGSELATFMWMMIPHHENAVNMAKLLMKEDALDTAGDRRLAYEAAKKTKGRRLDDDGGCPDCAIEDMLWAIVNVQGDQIITMEGWLADNDQTPAGPDVRCDPELPAPDRKLAEFTQKMEQLAAPKARAAAAKPETPQLRQRRLDVGTSEKPCISTNCADGVCTFTAIIDPSAGPTGYFKFEECGDVAMPVIGMEQGVTYKFDQKDASNWYHPLGMAYFPDGAHEGVDELEPSISQSGAACADDNTCQAPMYFKNGEFAGAEYDNQVSPVMGGEDFGLDNYEPEFFIPRDAWLETEYAMHVTLTDENPVDIFYFCHIHPGMSGRVKIVDAAGTVMHAEDDPPLPADYYKFPSEYDQMCGGYGLEPYQLSMGKCGDESFLCDYGEMTEGSYADCLSSMNCAMDYNMRTTLVGDPVADFMYQMIPHHENAVNMAKLLMKEDVLDLNVVTEDRRLDAAAYVKAIQAQRDGRRRLDDDGSCPDCAIDNMLWDIVSVQAHQIAMMQGWLADNGFEATSPCEMSESGDEGEDGGEPGMPPTPQPLGPDGKPCDPGNGWESYGDAEAEDGGEPLPPCNPDGGDEGEGGDGGEGEKGDESDGASALGLGFAAISAAAFLL